MKTAQDELAGALSHLSELLGKYGHHSKKQIVDEILGTLKNSSPDYKRLAGVEVWGGAGAVWEVCLTPNWTANTDQREDERSFLQTLIGVADAMERLQIGNERSRSLAKTFREWLKRKNI